MLIRTTDLCWHVDILCCEKIDPILPPLVGLWQTGRRAEEIQMDFEIFKILYRLNYLFGLPFYLITLQCYYSIRTAFQSTFVN